MSARRLSELQGKVLLAMRDLEAETPGSHSPNEIALRIGVERFTASRHGRGNTTRRLGPAHQIIAPMTGLAKRDLIAMRDRRDGLSGTAYVLTASGRTEADRLAREAAQ